MEEVERVQVKYLKWTLGLDRCTHCTPDYLVPKETNTDKVSVRTGERAMKYDVEARKSDKVLVKECITQRERIERKDGSIGTE